MNDAVDMNNSNKKSRRFTQKSNRKPSKPWFSKDLEVLKRNLRKAGNAFLRSNRDDTLRQRFFKLKKQFKMEVKHRKRKFKQGLYDKLESLSNDNPKE